MPTDSDLFAAIDGDHADDLEALLAEDPALAEARDDDGVGTVLHALYRGRREIAERLAGALPELDIFDAAALGRADRVRELLAADPFLAAARSPDGFTALHYPAFFGGTEAAETAQALIDEGADPGARSDNEFWVLPLHSAAAGAHGDVVEVLLAAGAQPDPLQRHGWTPLHAAAQNGDRRSLEALLAAGADPELRNDAGLSPADVAREAGHLDLAARLA
jgi:uncharacterized protein